MFLTSDGNVASDSDSNFQYKAVRVCFSESAAACFDAVNNHIYFIGGYNYKDKQLTSVERLNVTSEGQPVGEWQLVPPMKTRRSNCAAALVNEK